MTEPEQFQCIVCGEPLPYDACCHECYLDIKKKEHLANVSAYQDLWAIPARYAGASVDDDPVIGREIVEILNGIKAGRSKNVSFSGGNGLGKTWMAVAMVREAIQMGMTAIFVDVTRLLAEIKNTWNDTMKYNESDLLDYIASVDLLIIDDLGKELASSDWAHGELYKIVSIRSADDRSIGITTNLTMREIRERSPQMAAVMSRVIEDAVVFKYEGESRRKAERTVEVHVGEHD